MRVGFLLALLAVSLFYAYYAFVELSFLGRSGRLGPGFFPRIIGIGLVALCLLCLARDLRRARTDDMASDYWLTILVVAVLSAGMIWLFTLVGGPLAMGFFLFATLSFLNRGHVLQNALVAVLLPTGIFFLFDVWLNASMPVGRLSLPI